MMINDHNEFVVFMDKYPELLDGVLYSDDRWKAMDTIFKNSGFRKVSPTEYMTGNTQNLINEFEAFILERYGIRE